MLYWSWLRRWSNYGSHCTKMPHIKVTVVDVNEARITAWNDKTLSKLLVYEPSLDV